ncbi:MAG: AraC family transcriptional regulator [Lachnospiraceae bacterium]|nr:AraC family transcriptional regulator [Lachnospiraceae bacterium]
MHCEHETVHDDELTQVYFSSVENSDCLVPAHWHQHLEILYIAKGQMTAYINETSYELLPCDILIVNPHDIHYTHALGDCHYYLLQIPSVHLERISTDWRLLHFSEYLPRDLSPDSLNFRLGETFREFIDLDQNREKGWHLLFFTRLYYFLYLLYTNGSSLLSAQNKKRTERDFLRIEQSMLYVRKHYREQISLNQIAAQLSVTPEYFCRLFKKYTGQTFFTYVSQVRLMRFYQELIQTDESITYLLEKNGITNYKLFMRMFRETYGTTPHKLRMRHKDRTC